MARGDAAIDDDVIDPNIHGFDYSLDDRSKLLTVDVYAGFRQFFIHLHMLIAGYFQNGISRCDSCRVLRGLTPNRAYFYEGVDIYWADRVVTMADIERQTPEGLVGFKFYPSSDMIDPESQKPPAVLHDDLEAPSPFFEKTRGPCVTRFAFHKAYTLGSRVEAMCPEDVLAAAMALPNVTSEIMHGGFVFVQETAFSLRLMPNIYVKPELSGGPIVRQPRRFAEMPGTLISFAGNECIWFASGCANVYVDPSLRKFMECSMLEELEERCDFQEIIDDLTHHIVGAIWRACTGLTPTTSAPRSPTACGPSDAHWARWSHGSRGGLTPSLPPDPVSTVKIGRQGALGPLGVAQVRSLLCQIVDPCSAGTGCPVGFEDMGLVWESSVSIRDDGGIAVLVQMRVTEPGCIVLMHFDRKARILLGEPSKAVVDIAWDDDGSWSGPSVGRCQGVAGSVPEGDIFYPQRTPPRPLMRCL